MAKKRDIAVKAKRLRPVKGRSGYYIYDVEIENMDGTRTTEPVVGKDLQHALSKINSKRKKVRVVANIERIPVAVRVLLGISVVYALSLVIQNPVWYTSVFFLYLVSLLVFTMYLDR